MKTRREENKGTEEKDRWQKTLMLTGRLDGLDQSRCPFLLLLMNGSCMGGCQVAINVHSSIVSLQNEGVGGGGSRERERTTDRAQGDGEGETERQILGEMGGRQTIDRQTDILGGQREKDNDRDKGDGGGGGGRQTDLRGDGRETDD